MKTFITFFVGFLLINQLGRCQPELIDLIKFEYDFEQAEPLNMSEIISDISYVPLETNPECLIGYMYISIFGEDIIIQSHNNISIFRFSDKGKFINKIGKNGRGPAEYQDYTEIRLIEDTVFVVSSFTNDIICYSITGDFLKRYHIDLKAHINSIVQLPDQSFMVALRNPSNYGNILKTDKVFNIKTGFLNDVPFNSNPILGFRKSKNKIYYYYNHLDTIFEITGGYPIPSIEVNFGKYKTSKHKLSIDERRNTILNKPAISDFYASDEYLKLTAYYPYMQDYYTLLYRAVDNKQVVWSKLVNDIDNGVLDKWPGILFEDRIVFWLMPLTILERFNDMTNAEKSDPRNSGFVDMASKLLPDSNPVLMICMLR